jgi:hypothetical protein
MDRLRHLLDALRMLAKRLDDWRRKQENLPGRRLVELGLKGKK